MEAARESSAGFSRGEAARQGGCRVHPAIKAAFDAVSQVAPATGSRHWTERCRPGKLWRLEPLNVRSSEPAAPNPDFLWRNPDPKPHYDFVIVGLGADLDFLVGSSGAPIPRDSH